MTCKETEAQRAREAGERPDSPCHPSSACAPARLSRRAALGRGVLGLGLAWSLAACAVPEEEALQTGSLEPEPEPVRGSQDDLARLREGGDPIVAGETLDGTLLRRFYHRRGYVPVWSHRPAAAEAMAEAVLHAASHGLDPEMFHGSLVQRIGMFPPLRQELLLSHAALTYAEALAFGAVPLARRMANETLAAEPVDVTAVLDSGLEAGDPVAAIEALAPRTATYRALREALQGHRRGDPGEILPPDRLRRIEANLERQRWLPRNLPADRVWVNVADQRLVLYRDHRPVFTTRVVVGDEMERKQSPEFRTLIEGAFFNPPWIIPRDIVAADILPRLERDPGFLTRYNITLLPNGEAEQAPGPQAGLGVIMFDMPNRFDVYLHDTPDRDAFGRENRRISNGCIRVHNPLEFAALLMEEPIDSIQAKVAAGGTVRKPLPRPVPVFVLYHTAFASADGELETRPDFYGRDAMIWRRLYKRPPEAIAPAVARLAPVAGPPRRVIQPANAPGPTPRRR